jgi:uncharacterized protein
MLPKKRSTITFVLFVFVISYALMGFVSEAFSQTASKADWPKQITIGVTGGETGASYPVMAGLAKMIEKHLGVPVRVTSTAGHDGTTLMNKRQMDIIFPSTVSALEGLYGAGPLKSIGPTPMRAWLQANIMSLEYISQEKSGIKSFSDLKGKIVCIGPSVTTVPDQVFAAIAAAHDLDPKTVRITKWDRPTEAYDGLKSNKFDMIQVQGMTPTAATTELVVSNPGRIRLVDLDKSRFSEVKKKLPWIVPEVIPAGTYKGIDRETTVPAVAMFMATHRDLPDSFVYAMTKMVWDNFNEFSSYHPLSAKFKAVDVTKIVDAVPYHTGAIKYYREAGIWNKDLDARQAATLAALPEAVR